jgi:hypothetical protein
METAGSSQVMACDQCRRLKVACIWPGQEKKEKRERQRKREEQALLKGQKRKQVQVKSLSEDLEEETAQMEKSEQPDFMDAMEALTNALGEWTAEARMVRKANYAYHKALIKVLEDLHDVVDEKYALQPEDVSEEEVEVMEVATEVPELEVEREESGADDTPADE